MQFDLKSKIAKKANDLVVVAADNCQDNLMLIGFVLEALKLKYYLATDGKTALNLVYEKRPDLVLLDIIMPKMDGIEVNTLMKSDRATRHIPTLAITGLTEQEHITAIMNVGFNDYIIKPFMIEDLEAMVERLINK